MIEIKQTTVPKKAKKKNLIFVVFAAFFTILFRLFALTLVAGCSMNHSKESNCKIMDPNDPLLRPLPDPFAK